MKNEYAKAVGALRRFYAKMLRERAPGLYPKLRIVCFFSASESRNGGFIISFEFRPRKGISEPGLFETTLTLFPQLKLRSGELSLARKLGLKVRTARYFYEEFNSFSYRKVCRLPAPAFSDALRSKQKEFRWREKKLELMVRLVEKTHDILSNDLTGPPRLESWLRKAAELYKEAGGKSFWSEVGLFGKQIRKSFALGGDLILETAY